MLDIKFVRENPEVVKENIRKKFQDVKLPLVDEVLELDKENRAIKQEVEALRAERNKLSKQIGGLMAKGEKVGVLTVRLYRPFSAKYFSHPSILHLYLFSPVCVLICAFNVLIRPNGLPQYEHLNFLIPKCCISK